MKKMRPSGRREDSHPICAILPLRDRDVLSRVTSKSYKSSIVQLSSIVRASIPFAERSHKILAVPAVQPAGNGVRVQLLDKIPFLLRERGQCGNGVSAGTGSVRERGQGKTA